MAHPLTRDEITRRRIGLGLSKAAFGREAKLHVSTVSQIESDGWSPVQRNWKESL